MRHWILLLLLAIPGPQAEEPQVRDLSYFLQKLYDLDGLPYLEDGGASDQASSYDRSSRYVLATGKYVNWKANTDHGHYIRVDAETGEAVMADLKGPGCIQRIWSANPKGRIRFYMDGAAEALEFSFEDLCTGKIHPFEPPLVWKRSEMLGTDNPASDCYFPIPYKKSCRVTADKAYDQYYHIGYATFPPNTPVKSFALHLSEKEEAALVVAKGRLNNLGMDPQVQPLTPIEGAMTVEPGTEVMFASIDQRAVIHRLCLGVESDERYILRKVLFKAYWDGEGNPEILSPMGDFFGQSFNNDPYRSLPLGFDNGMGYCFFRMPIDERARFFVKNQGKKAITLRFDMGYRPVEAHPDNFAHFHAGWRREKYCNTFDYPVLRSKGRGKFVGMALFVDNVHGGWWGEGDEKIYVDGENFPSYFGTGSEDYFGDAWGIRDFVTAYHGCPLTVGSKQCCYRWHIADPIPFRMNFRFTIENYTAGENVKNDYASIAYWYQQPKGSEYFKEPGLEDLRPMIPSRVAGALEAESLFTKKEMPENVRVVSDEDLPFDLSAGAGLELPGTPGSIYYLPLNVPRRDTYKIRTVAAPVEGAPRFKITMNNQPVGERVLLNKGKVLLRLDVGGGGKKNGAQSKLILDYLVLEPVKKFIHQWALVGPFDGTDEQGLSTPYPPELEEEFDLSKSYPGKGGDPVEWKLVEASEKGHVDLVPLITPNNYTVAYAYATITSPAALETDMYVGSDDGVKVWLNGEVVHDNPVNRALQEDEDTVVVNLVQGINRILVKVDQGVGGWAFCLRFRDENNVLVHGKK